MFFTFVKHFVKKKKCQSKVGNKSDSSNSTGFEMYYFCNVEAHILQTLELVKHSSVNVLTWCVCPFFSCIRIGVILGCRRMFIKQRLLFLAKHMYSLRIEQNVIRLIFEYMTFHCLKNKSATNTVHCTIQVCF